MKNGTLFLACVFILVCAALGVSVASRRPAAAPAGGARRLKAVATIFPLYDMARAIGAGHADVTLLLVECPGPGSTPLMYRCVGLEPKDFKVVIVKSPAGFRAEFAPFAADIILSDCPGCASSRFAELPYRKINRPLWPLDQIDDWRKVDWIKGG